MSRYFTKLARRTGLVPDRTGDILQKPVSAVSQPAVKQDVPTSGQENTEVNIEETSEMVSSDTINETKSNTGIMDAPTDTTASFDTMPTRNDTLAPADVVEQTMPVDSPRATSPTIEPVYNPKPASLVTESIDKLQTTGLTTKSVDNPQVTGLTINDRPEITAPTDERQYIVVPNSQTAVYVPVETDTKQSFEQTEAAYSSGREQPLVNEQVIPAGNLVKEADSHSSKLNNIPAPIIENREREYNTRPSADSASGTQPDRQDKASQVVTQPRTAPNEQNESSRSRPYENLVDVHIRSISFEIHQAAPKTVQRPAHSPRLSRYYLRGY